MAIWGLFTADADGRPLDCVHQVTLEEAHTVIIWQGRTFAYDDNGGVHVEVTPFMADAPAMTRYRFYRRRNAIDVHENGEYVLYSDAVSAGARHAA